MLLFIVGGVYDLKDTGNEAEKSAIEKDGLRDKARGTGPRAFISGTSISTCRPCREQQEQRERGARACR